MQILFSILLAAIACAIVALHALSAAYPTKSVFNYVNIALHIIIVAPLLLLGASLEHVALVFIASLLLYLALGTALSAIRNKGAAADKETEGGSVDDL